MVVPSTHPARKPPKYWNESINPDENPDIFRPPMSIAAAVPSSECVEFAVNEISTKNMTVALTEWNCAAERMMIVSMKYSAAATGARLDLKNRSEAYPLISEPADATNGINIPVHQN